MSKIYLLLVPIILLLSCDQEKTVMNETFPFISKVHVAIRSDLDNNSMAYKLYEWLQSENAKTTIKECGFLTK